MVLLDHFGSVYILEKDLAFVVESSLFGGASFECSAARSNDRVDTAILPAKSNQVDIFIGCSCSNPASSICRTTSLECREWILPVSRLDWPNEMKALLSQLNCRLDRAKPRVADHNPAASMPWLGKPKSGGRCCSVSRVPALALSCIPFFPFLELNANHDS